MHSFALPAASQLPFPCLPAELSLEELCLPLSYSGGGRKKSNFKKFLLPRSRSLSKKKKEEENFPRRHDESSGGDGGNIFTALVSDVLLDFLFVKYPRLFPPDAQG